MFSEWLMAQGWLEKETEKDVGSNKEFVRPGNETEWIGIQRVWTGRVEISVPLADGSPYQYRTSFATEADAFAWLEFYLQRTLLVSTPLVSSSPLVSGKTI